MNGVFRSDSAKRQLDDRYRAYLRRWEVAAEHRLISTRHGETFVVACGADDAPPAVLPRAAFGGASLGGWLATDFAIRRPDRVERHGLRATGCSTLAGRRVACASWFPTPTSRFYPTPGMP